MRSDGKDESPEIASEYFGQSPPGARSRGSPDDLRRCILGKSGSLHHSAMNTTGIPPSAVYPTTPAWYFSSSPSLVPGIPDQFLAVLAPLPAYWVVSTFFYIIDTLDLFAKYRIHDSAEVKSRNRASKSDVFFAVILQQAIQTALGYWWMSNPGEPVNPQQGMQDIAQWSGAGPAAAWWLYWWGIPTFQMLLAM